MCVPTSRDSGSDRKFVRGGRDMGGDLISQKVFIQMFAKVNSRTNSSTYRLSFLIKFQIDDYVGELTF
jgi:hypothetical protein